MCVGGGGGGGGRAIERQSIGEGITISGKHRKKESGAENQ